MPPRAWSVAGVGSLLTTIACSHGGAAPCPMDSGPPDTGLADAGTVDAAAACSAAGSWTLAENGCTCGGCTDGIQFNLAFLISPQVAAEGGTFIDSDDMTWTFDPGSCSATLTGNCDASDTMDFRSGTARCFWTCAGVCPPCAAACTLQHQ